MDEGWFRRRWMEFRWGHGTYLAFFLNGVNFVLIVYRMLIDYVAPLKAIFSSLRVFVMFYLVVYPLLAISVGHWHRKKQLAIDASLQVEASPYAMENYERLKRIETLLNKMIERGMIDDKSK